MTVWLATIAFAIPAGQGAEPPTMCHTYACHHRVALRMHRARWKNKPWQHRYHHLPAAVKARLRSVRMCESGDRPWAVSAGGTYRGFYQYDRPTARAAGFTRDPATLTSAEGRAEQHVRTAWYAMRTGWRPWPICGRR